MSTETIISDGHDPVIEAAGEGIIFEGGGIGATGYGVGITNGDSSGI